jgi:hypothetical protein
MFGNRYATLKNCTFDMDGKAIMQRYLHLRKVGMKIAQVIMTLSQRIPKSQPLTANKLLTGRDREKPREDTLELIRRSKA